MIDYRALSDAHWRGEADLAGAEHPVVSGFVAPTELANGLLFFRSVAGFAVIDSGDGLVMIDSGTPRDTPRILEAVRAWRPDVPLVAATYSHHHHDHIWGTRPFDAEAAERGWARPVVYAHASLPANLDRYRKTQAWNLAINQRQFLGHRMAANWPIDYRYPDVTFEDSLTLRRGELSFEMHHARGETDDHVWVWVPERGWLFPGDLFIWAVPNAGNPQKVQRYCADWAAALRQMAGLGAELMVPGHGVPIFGAERVRSALVDTAEYLESIESQTVALMNRALPLDEIIHRVRPPEHLADRPYLQPVYDHPQFLVRNIWRRYGGWWDGEPDNLLPAPRAVQAREWVMLAGGISPVLARAAALEAGGDLRMACHLVELAVLAEPGSDDAHAARQRIYAARSAAERATMSRGIFANAAASSAEKRRDRLAAPDQDV
ncbi:MAG: MBL fold metallo-hydrolase [Burkholderiaceae bacterium]|nr:MBL fold metallo-hydrolase [Burkholderiaceae bacterium]